MQDTESAQLNIQYQPNDLRSIQSRTFSEENALGEKINLEVQIDASYQNGPFIDSKRELTDKFCLFILIIGLILFVLIFIYALMNGDVEQILIPFNDRGLKCGIDQEVKDCPYSMALKQYSSNRIFCVQTCPQQNNTIITCQGENLLSDYNTTLWENVCLSEKDNEIAPNIISHQRNFWITIIVISILSFYVSHFVNDLTSKFVERALILIIVESLILIGFTIYYSVKFFTNNYQTNIEYIDQFQLAIQILAIIIVMVLFGFQVFICKYKGVIQAIILESLRFYENNQYLILFTAVLCLAILSTFIIFIISIYYLIGCGKSEYYPNNPIPTFELSQFVAILIIIQSSITFWIISCIVQIGKFLVSINSAKWYFRNEKELLSPTRESIYTCFRYHIGSIALGAILFQFYYIAQVICFITQPFIYLAQLVFQSNKEIHLQNYIYFLNSKSLTFIAFTGDNIFTASRKYCQLIKRSKKIMQFSDYFGELISFDIKLIIGIFLAQSFYVHSPFGPLTIFLAIISCTISNCVINNWSFAMDTILVFYFIDKEANKNEKWTPVFLKAYLDEQEEQVRIMNQVTVINQLEQKKQYIQIQIQEGVGQVNHEMQNLQQELENLEEDLINAQNYLLELRKIFGNKQLKLNYRRLYF